MCCHCFISKLFSRRETCHAFTQAAGFGWKTETHTSPRYIYVHWCWQSICYVTVCTRGDLQATCGIQEKSGMIYSQQWVCDTSPVPQPQVSSMKFWRPGAEVPEEKSLLWKWGQLQTHGSQKVPAWVTVRNIYRTDILTTINDNCFLYGRRNGATRWDNWRANAKC